MRSATASTATDWSEIFITEDPHEHLVWIESRIFPKPLPEYLLSADFWTDHLCGNEALFKFACGLWMSYSWLIRYQSDIILAKDLGLLPKFVEWVGWTTFIGDFLSHVNPDSLELVSDRYKYGELRLARLNKLYRVKSPRLSNMVHGYMSSPTWYQDYFSKNFAWLLAVFVYVTVILSAMQVCLATAQF